ncbi:hypothetical protein CVT26_004730 [Gymnopilus dilepis]|uniref:Uncharacterized protein n=1 Tax=Gymnopilus dilepis TaxID=231916 RepID=A0A409XZ94_9AGAR|nr:hypothetical protein CVT26_004730 [Gymnopilus dilepis]
MALWDKTEETLPHQHYPILSQRPNTVIADMRASFKLGFPDAFVPNDTVEFETLSATTTITTKEMARRGAPAAHPSYLPHPQHDVRALNDPNESAFSRFLRTEVFAPEKLPGNISIASALGVFFGGIVVIRTWGDLLVPA